MTTTMMMMMMMMMITVFNVYVANCHVYIIFSGFGIHQILESLWNLKVAFSMSGKSWNQA